MAEPLNATFFAFGKRERGGVLLRATLAYAAIAIVLFAGFVAINYQGVVDYFSWVMMLSEHNDGVDPTNPFPAMMPPASVMALAPMYLLFNILFYLLFAAYEAACLRWMIRGETKGFFGLALDADTWRVWFTYWIWLLLLIVVYVVCALAAFGFAAALLAGAPSSEPSPALALVPLAVIVGVLIVLAVFGVRFAPAAATSIAKQRFAFFDAWTVTKGRFWALLGAFVLLFLMYFVGLIILSLVMSVTIGVSMFGQLSSQGEPQSPQEAFALLASPGVLIPVVVIYGIMIVGAFIFYIALFGVNARAARAALNEGKIKPAV